MAMDPQGALRAKSQGSRVKQPAMQEITYGLAAFAKRGYVGNDTYGLAGWRGDAGSPSWKCK